MKETPMAISRRTGIHGLWHFPPSAGLLRTQRVKGREEPSKTLHELLLKRKWPQGWSVPKKDTTIMRGRIGEEWKPACDEMKTQIGAWGEDGRNV
jgi:hypothetical protein